MAAPELTLYYRESCHLCEDMLQALRGLQLQLGFDLRMVDVDRDPGLAGRYGEWVPVLCLENQEVCHYHLDQRKLRRLLHRRR